MPVSKSIAAARGVLIDAREILIPFALAKRSYGPLVASIVDQLNNSGATEAKDKPLEQFKWYLSYTQPDDPDTSDAAEFSKVLIDSTRVFLLCRGFRWKAAAELVGGIPEQIRSRYEERARLITSTKKAIIEEAGEAYDSGVDDEIENITISNYPAVSVKRQKSIADDINAILVQVSALSENHHVDMGYVNIITLALKNLKGQVSGNRRK
jgi:hypothetical protein